MNYINLADDNYNLPSVELIIKIMLFINNSKYHR